MDHAVIPPKLAALAGTWAAPPDLPAKVALGLAVGAAVAALLGRGRSVLGLGEAPVSTRRFLEVSALAAALLSVGYTALYLRGGPRIIDATTYWLEGRALADGGSSWTVPFPSASFRGRFLLFREPKTLAGIFPPGHPLLLALGFGLRAPMVVGPLLAAGLVAATYRLTRAIANETSPPRTAEATARAAALLSVLCAALRYHTADTMAHATCALGIAMALERALAASRRDAPRTASLAFGLALGYVAATRPVSALAPAIVGVVLLGRGARPRRFASALVGVVPGLLLLTVAQHGATGAWLASSQRAYYAIADGPPDCFRWGFGAGIGCLHEHGEFVQTRLPSGHGLVEAAGTTLRRLHAHLLDVANLEPLALLVLAPLGSPRRRAESAALALVLLHVLAYAPFYFDGNYPGGGARLLADVLPLEHALVAIAAVRFAARPSSPGPSALVDARTTRAAMLLAALVLAGFAVHAAHEHEKLATRDGGRPMFEPDVLARAHVTRGLVFVDTDHGFGLAHQPGATPSTGVVVARLRDDDHDGLLYDRLGRPPTWLYERSLDDGPSGARPASVVPWTPHIPGDSLRLEAEAEWPPLAQEGGFAAPAWTDACASGGRALVLTPRDGSVTAQAILALPVPASGRYRIVPRIVHGARVPFAEARLVPSATSRGELRIGGETWTWSERPGSAPPDAGACEDLGGVEVELDVSPSRPEAHVVVTASGGPVAVDRLMVQRLP